MSKNIELNTDAEQIKILRAVIEKRPVYFYRTNGNREEFNGLMPDFSMYRYELAQPLRAKVVVTEHDKIIGMATLRAYDAQYAGGVVNLPSILELWYEDGKLNVADVGTKPSVIHLEARAAPTFAGPGAKASYAHPVVKTTGEINEELFTKVRLLADEVRNRLRKNKSRFRTAQLCSTTKSKYHFTSAAAELDSKKGYYAIFVLKDRVLVSESPMSAEQLLDIKLQVGYRVPPSSLICIAGRNFHNYAA